MAPLLLLATAVLASTWLGKAHAMRQDYMATLRDETIDMFYHGYSNYMRVAFPEDEVRDWLRRRAPTSICLDSLRATVDTVC